MKQQWMFQNMIEVWSKDTWVEYYNSSKESFEEIAEKLMTDEV